MIVAKIELSEIAVQVMLGTVLIGALHAPLEDAVIVFDRLGVDLRIGEGDVLLVAVVHGVVAAFVEAHGQLVVARLVGEDFGLTGYVSADNRADGGRLQVIDDNAASLLRVAVHERQHLHLVTEVAFFHCARFGANESLVNLDTAAAGTERIQSALAHSFADTVRQEPCRLVLDLKDAVQLVGADTLFAGAHEVDGLQPLRQRQVAFLEDRTNADRELLAAVGALV